MSDQLQLFDLPEPYSQLPWVGETAPKREEPKRDENPCIALYGPGPEGKRCKDCLWIAGICKSKTYYKCKLRENTHGKATDHKLRWPACGRFEERSKAIPLYDGRG